MVLVKSGSVKSVCSKKNQALNIGGRSIGIPSDVVPKQHDEIIKLNQKWSDDGVDFRLFHGSECDILADGKLDYSENVRNIFSHVVGSIHAVSYTHLTLPTKA